MYFSVSTVINEDHISISKQYPREVMLNDSFDIEFSITNIDKVDHKLNSIDICLAYKAIYLKEQTHQLYQQIRYLKNSLVGF